MRSNGFVALFLFLMIALGACSSGNIEQRKDWKKYFKEEGIDGCFMFHNPADSKFEVYNLGLTQVRYLPAGTFLIIDAMAGLETGVISDTNMVLSEGPSQNKADALKNADQAPTSGLTMREAFRTSDIPYFQEIARRIGPSKMQYWIDSVYYGNKIIGTKMDSFWLDNTLKISPDEQLGLVERLYYGKLSFQPRTQRLVKDLMLVKKMPDYSLYYKTGFGQGKDKQIGWVVGWVEKNNHPFSFTLLTKAPHSMENLPEISLKILNRLLQDLNLNL